MATIDVTDIRMPGINGRVLADRLLAVRPGIAVVFISGHGESGRDDVQDTGWPLLEKPFATPALFDAVRRASSREASPAGSTLARRTSGQPESPPDR